MHDLFKKYDVPGPRYTSYPTVPYWSTTPTTEQWISSLRKALDSRAGAAIYIHIPFCKSLCTYCGCNTRIVRDPKVAIKYVDTVIKEWKIYLSLLEKDVQLSDLHIGGGTPTFLEPEDLERLVEGILSTVKISPGAEFSLEADPRTTTHGHLEKLSRLGFKRLSLGIQDFDTKVQEIVHRVQSEELVEKATKTARDLGYNSINYDLIYGLPLQTTNSIEHTIMVLKRLRPDRIAFYGYAHVPWIKPGQRRFSDADVPAGESKRALYEHGRKLLQSAGYKEIGLDHFALETDQLWKAYINGNLHRNFMGYVDRFVLPLVGLGVSAISDSWDAFAQNEKTLETYQQRIDAGQLPILRGHLLTDEDRVLRKHILNIMTKFITNWDSESEYTPHLDEAEKKLALFANDGLIRHQRKSCEVTETGRAFLRNICMAFDARLFRNAPETNLFSKTV
ncbi:MAG: oxygen-independent coproporphyrinogen III oxidase [Candidatus Poribacteria bacterium]